MMKTGDDDDLDDSEDDEDWEDDDDLDDSEDDEDWEDWDGEGLDDSEDYPFDEDYDHIYKTDDGWKRLLKEWDEMYENGTYAHIYKTLTYAKRQILCCFIMKLHSKFWEGLQVILTIQTVTIQTIQLKMRNM